MTNLIYRCAQSGHFFLNLSTFFQFSKRGREGFSSPPHLLARLFTIKLKEKGKKSARGNTCRRNWNSSCNVQGKTFWKNMLVWNFSAFHFCSTLHKWNSPHFSTAGTFTEQLFSGTAIITENVRWLLLKLQKFSSYNLETSFFIGKDPFNNRYIQQ